MNPPPLAPAVGRVARAGALALGSVAFISAGCSSEIHCLLDCFDVFATSDLGVPASEEAHLRVRACYNGPCGETSLSADQPNGGFETETAYVSCWLRKEGSGRGSRWKVEVGLQVVNAAPEDGDLAVIAITDEDTGRTSGVRATVDYEMVDHVCLQCEQALLTIPPP